MHRRLIGKAEHDAADVALVRQVGGLRLKNDGKTEVAGGGGRLVGGLRQLEVGDRQAEGREQGF